MYYVFLVFPTRYSCKVFTVCEDFLRDVTPENGENFLYILNLFIFIYN